MTPDTDDVLLTAYALNELAPEQTADVEARLATDPAARQTVAEVRAAAAQLTTYFAADDGEVADAPPMRLTYAPANPRRRRAVAALAAAAAVAVGVAGFWAVQTSLRVRYYGLRGEDVAPPHSVRKDSGLDSTGGNLASPPGTTSHAASADAVSAARRSAGTVSVPASPGVGNGEAAVQPGHTEGPVVTFAVPSKAFVSTPGGTGLATYRGQADTLTLVPAEKQSTRAGIVAVASTPPLPSVRYDMADSVVLPTDDLDVARKLAPPVRTRTYVGTTDPRSDETYRHPADDGFRSPADAPLSTFAVNVDTASFANVRRFVEQQNRLPPADAVRIEELVNAFGYAPAKPAGEDPIGVGVEVAACPWAPGHELARVAVNARPLAEGRRPACNLVFLVDVSGSMSDENKLPLLKVALSKLANRLTADDRVTIVTYAGVAQTNLTATACDDGQPLSADQAAQAKALIDQGRTAEAAAMLGSRGPSGRQRILDAIAGLHADGSTNGGDGIRLAYQAATSSFVKGGVNRVILSTDGDFNVGMTSPAELDAMIDREADTGVFLTVLGVGMGNLKDATMEGLAAHGRGNYAYLDSPDEAERVLVKEADATLVAVARDVKVQVEFNPAKVASYRLIGYADRHLAAAAFNDDGRKAGEMGAGQAVTALYEVVPVGATPAVDPLKYGTPAAATRPASAELMTVKVRYQPPAGGESRRVDVPVSAEATVTPTADFRFAAAVAEFGLALRHAPDAGTATVAGAADRAADATGEDADGRRHAFVRMARRAAQLARP